MPDKYLDYTGLQELVVKTKELVSESAVTDTNITDTTAYKISGATDNLALPTQSQMEVLEVRGNSIVSHNLWDKDTYPFTNNYAINDETGVSFSFSDYSSILGYVPLKANTQYTVWANVGTIQALFYDNSKTYISATSYVALNTFTTPNNTVYVRFCVKNSSANQIMLNYGSQDLPYEPYFEGIKNSKNNLVNTGVNLWDEVWEVGGINTTTGQNETGTGIRAKNYTRALGNTQYLYGYNSTILHVVYYYDVNKNFISMQYYQDGNNVFTTPANCQYIRIALGSDYGSTYKNDIAIFYGNQAQAYQPYTAHTLTINETLRSAGSYYDVIKNGKKTIRTKTLNLSQFVLQNVSTAFFRTTQNGFEFAPKGLDTKFITDGVNINNVFQVTADNGFFGVSLDYAWNNSVDFVITDTWISLPSSYDTQQKYIDFFTANTVMLIYATTDITETDYNEPLYLPVYMNGTEQQTGDVPYTLVRNYDISVRDQVITNVMVDAKQEEEIQNILKGIPFKTIDGVSIVGSGNIETGDGKGTDLYATKLILMDGTNDIPVFITDWVMTNEELVSEGVLTKADGLQLFKDISEDYASDLWVNHEVKENFGYWDGSQWQVAFMGASGVILDTNSELIRVYDNTGQQIGSDIYLSDIGDTDQSTYYFKAIARGDV